MATVNELKRENEKLRNRIEAKKEMIEIGRERNRLLKQNKTLLKSLKRGGKPSIVGEIGKLTGRATLRAGKSAGRFGLKTWKILGDMERQRLKNERRRTTKKSKRKVIRRKMKKR